MRIQHEIGRNLASGSAMSPWNSVCRPVGEFPPRQSGARQVGSEPGCAGQDGEGLNPQVARTSPGLDSRGGATELTRSLIARFYCCIDIIDLSYHAIAFRVPVELLWTTSRSEWRAITAKRVHEKGNRKGNRMPTQTKKVSLRFGRVGRIALMTRTSTASRNLTPASTSVST